MGLDAIAMGGWATGEGIGQRGDEGGGEDEGWYRGSWEDGGGPNPLGLFLKIVATGIKFVMKFKNRIRSTLKLINFIN